MNRRKLIGTLGAASLAGLWPLACRAATPRRVIVVGAGMAGATAAKYLRLWSDRGIDVTLVEPAAQYTSNIMSNLVVTGQYPPSILSQGYTSLSRKYGITLLQGSVTAVEPGGELGAWKVTVRNGQKTVTRWCERVVLAPGIQFDPVPSTADPAVAAPILHAWQAGAQTTQLRDALARMPATGTFVMSIPKAPYRCPPGPYERACVVADYLRRNKPGAQLVVLDANPDIMAEKENFSRAFQQLYGSNLSYRPNHVVRSVAATAGQAGGTVTVDIVVRDAAGAETVTGSETFSAQVLNVIPPHRAGAIVHTLGLADATGFAPVDGRSFESTVPGRAGIHVIGDASKTTLPKAGHVGNQGAKICADAIVRAFSAQPPVPAPTANSACFSPVSNQLASWLTAVYQYRQDPATGAWRYVALDQVTGATGATEAQVPSTRQFSMMRTWYGTLMSDSFA
ncbi:FAD-dependent oxidoreductase [Azohydromonas australica]|uniref:FAD-dependent oxidoreductase n=1 Tax=Azohydromonas australica TaxID=364039 RepID=UPI0005B9A746|nr:FAD/NAD(P)-binding oxidoreductase [Azohydromonas australica]